MKTITLVRHAKSSWRDRRLEDAERPLSRRGEREALLAGEALARQGAAPDLILSSPAKRARATAAVIARALGYPERWIVQEVDLYQSSAQHLLGITQGLDDRFASVLLVGHNLELSDFAGLLLSRPFLPILPTAGAVCIRFQARRWQDVREGGGESVFRVAPEWRQTDAARPPGKTPAGSRAAPDYPLPPGMRTEEAARVILRRLLAVLSTNEARIGKDQDPETLHDYRVAVRRTRSALGQIRKVFPAKETARFRKGFSRIGEKTNALRDLDVFLLGEASFKAALPPSIRKDVAPVFEKVRETREKEEKRVVKMFDTERYRRLIAAWNEFLASPPARGAARKNARVPARDLACRWILRRYQRVAEQGKTIIAAPSDEALHFLRIECKKLRYLLEFFSALFPPDRIRRLIAELKTVQDNLGRINDLSVHARLLRAAAEELPANDPRTARACAAVRALLRAIARDKETARKEFPAIFRAFSAPAKQKAYRDLYCRAAVTLNDASRTPAIEPRFRRRRDMC